MFLTLSPNALFFSNRSGNNSYDVHTVPLDRDSEDPFYIIPSVETDECIYWTGGDDFGNNVDYFVFKDQSNAV